MTTLHSAETSKLVHWKLDLEIDRQNLEVLSLDPATIHRGLVRNDSRFRLVPQEFIVQRSPMAEGNEKIVAYREQQSRAVPREPGVSYDGRNDLLVSSPVSMCQLWKE